MRTHLSRAIGLAMAVSVVFLMGSMFLPASITAPSARTTATDFTLEDSTGAAIKLSDFKGKVVVLDFWATWCHGCKIEIPWYMEFQKKYSDRGLSVIGVSMDDDGWKSVRPFLTENRLNYPVVIGNANLAKQFGVEGLPVTLLIDRHGKIAEVQAGMVDKSSFEIDIQSLLRENNGK